MTQISKAFLILFILNLSIPSYFACSASKNDSEEEDQEPEYPEQDEGIQIGRFG